MSAAKNKVYRNAYFDLELECGAILQAYPATESTPDNIFVHLIVDPDPSDLAEETAYNLSLRSTRAIADLLTKVADTAEKRYK